MASASSAKAVHSRANVISWLIEPSISARCVFILVTGTRRSARLTISRTAVAAPIGSLTVLSSYVTSDTGPDTACEYDRKTVGGGPAGVNVVVTVQRIRDNADDFDVARGTGALQRHVTADRILASKKDPGEFLVDHRRVRRAGTVALFDFAAPPQRNLHRGEELRTHRQHVAVLRQTARDRHVRTGVAGAEKGRVGQRHMPHAGDGRELGAEAIVEGRDLGIIVSGLPGVDLKGQQLLAVESELKGGRRTQHNAPTTRQSSVFLKGCFLWRNR